jgi:hypothetical protein
MQDFERDPLFKMDDIHDISKAELRERTMEKVIKEVSNTIPIYGQNN